MFQGIQTCQNSINNLSSCWIFYFPANLILSFITSYFSFTVFLAKIETFSDLKAYAKWIIETESDLKRVIRIFILQYALVSALLSSAIIDYQFKCLNISSAIFYGALGAYFLRDQIIPPLKEKVRTAVVSGIDKQVSNIVTHARDVARKPPDEAGLNDIIMQVKSQEKQEEREG